MSAKDVQAITAHHSKVRADVGVGPLQWSAALAAYAQDGNQKRRITAAAY